jgi:hypothetical protein
VCCHAGKSVAPMGFSSSTAMNHLIRSSAPHPEECRAGESNFRFSRGSSISKAFAETIAVEMKKSVRGPA